MLARRGVLVIPWLLAAEPPFDESGYDALVTGLLERYRIPGATLAVSKDGRMVLRRGYGWSDAALQVRMKPDAVLRIASLSKAITAVAILSLVDSNRLDVDAAAFELLPYLLPADRADLDPRILRITVRQLLEHQGGWDRAVSGEPTFRARTAAEAIRRALRRRLDFDPGTRGVYSNFGYAVLGRVIEKVTGTGYEQAVRQLVLEPAGIRSMRIDPALEALDAHGGWMSTSEDYVRFLNAIDGRGGRRLLPARAVELLTERPANAPSKEAWYAMGLMVRPQGGGANWWHDGALDSGTRTLAVRTHHGWAWAAFFNRMPPLDSDFLREADSGLWKALRQATAAGARADRVN